MAMVKCRECSADISDTAKACPKCGYKLRDGRSGCLPAVGIVAVALLVTVIFVSSKSDSEPPSEKRLAQIACREFVKRVLNDPDSAVFDDTEQFFTTTERSRGLWSVTVTGRARNAFNAMVRFSY